MQNNSAAKIKSQRVSHFANEEQQTRFKANVSLDPSDQKIIFNFNNYKPNDNEANKCSIQNFSLPSITANKFNKQGFSMKKLNQILQSHIIVDEIPLEENHHIMYSIVILSKGRSGIPNIIGQESKIALLNLSQIKQVLINQAIIIRSGVKQNYTNITNSSDFQYIIDNKILFHLMQVEVESQLQKTLRRLEEKKSKASETAIVMLKSIEEALIKKEVSCQAQETGVLLSLLELVLAHSKDAKYEHHLAVFQILNLMLNGLTQIGCLKMVASRLLPALEETLKNQGQTQTGKYVVAVFGQMVLAMDTGYEGYMHSLLLNNIYHDNPMVRKQTAKTLRTLLKVRLSNKDVLSGQIKKTVMDNLLENERTTQFSVAFIQKTLEQLQISVKNDLLYGLVKALAVSNDRTKCMIMLCFEEQLKQNTINSSLAESILKEILENQVYFDNNNVKLIVSYSQCLVQAMAKLRDYHNPVCDQYFSAVFSILSELFFLQTTEINVHEFAQKTLEMLIVLALNRKRAIQETDDLAMIMDLDLEQDQQKKQPSHQQKAIAMLQYLLSSRFHAVQKECLNVLATFFSVVDQDMFSQLTVLIEQITGLALFELEEYQLCYGQIIKCVGLSNILTKYPIRLRSKDLPFMLVDAARFERNTNLWIVPVITRHLKRASLAVFLQQVYPLLQQIEKIQGSIEDTYINNFIYTIRQMLWQILSVSYEQSVEDSYDMNQVADFLQMAVSEQSVFPKYILKGLELFMCNSKVNVELVELIKSKADGMVPQLAMLYKTEERALMVIQELGWYCSPSFLDKVYHKNINKLNQSKVIQDIHDLDILIAISHSVDIRSEKIDQALAFLEIFCGQESTQKKSYRFALLLIKKLHQSHHNQILTIIQNHTTFPNSKYNKLLVFHYMNKCTQKNHRLDNQAIFQAIQTYLPDILLALRDNNAKTRRFSQDFLLEIASNFDQQLLQEYISMILAGFASQYQSLKCNSIKALQILFDHYTDKIDWEFEQRIFKIIIMMVQEKNKEIYLQLISYTKSLMKRLSVLKCKQILSQVLDALLAQDSVHRLQFRTQVKNLIAKMVKKLGEQVVEQNSPEEQIRMVRYVIKTKRKEKAKKGKPKKLIDRNMIHVERAFAAKAEKDEKKKLKKMNLSNKNFKMDDENMDEEFDDEKRGNNDIKRAKNNNLLLKYDANEENFHFAEHPINQKKEAFLSQKSKKEKEASLVQYVKGKIVVKEEIEEGGKKRKREGEDKYATIQSYINNNEQKIEQRQQRKIMSGLRVKSKSNIHNFIESGTSFKSNKSHGDVLQAGKPDPYAFIQLNPKALNKKFKDKSANAFESITSQKQSGAFKGLKQKKFKSQ